MMEAPNLRRPARPRRFVFRATGTRDARSRVQGVPLFDLIGIARHRPSLVTPFWSRRMPVASPRIASRPPATRSRAANRPGSITGADGRSAGARLLRDTEAELANEFFGCEPAGLSPSQRLAVSAVAALRVRLEGMRSAVARGDAIDDEAMTRLSNAIGRELSRLERQAASQRKAKASGGPDALKAYLANKAAREAVA